MAKIFLEATDNDSTIGINGASVFGTAGNQVVAIAASNVKVDAAVERIEFAGAMSEYTFKQIGPNALEVAKGGNVTTVVVQDDANGTQLTFTNGTVNTVLGTAGMTIGGTAVSQTAGAIVPGTIDTSVVTPVEPGPVVGLNLTVEQDILAGTSGADTFVSRVAQNVFGAQVNTLGSGDVINGGDGIDTLNAKITSGFFAGNTNNGTMPIQPETNSVEIVKLQAVNANIGSSIDYDLREKVISDGPDSTTVYVNAKDMDGVNFIGSDHSDANLVIQNMTTKDSAGVARELNTMTVGMAYSGNADSSWNESDLHVYFDQDYLNPHKIFTKPSIDFRLMNEDAYDETINLATGVRPLDGVYVGQMDFHLNGVTYHLAPYLADSAVVGALAEPVTGSGSEVSTYAQQLEAIQKAIVKLKADNASDAALQTLQATNGVDFTSDISPATGQLRHGTTITLTVEGATNGTPNTLTVAPTDLQLLRAPAATVGNNNRFERAELTPPTSEQILAINVALEKVGLAGDGGELIIGSMFKDGSNDYDPLYVGKGIQEFDVTVYGGSDKPSSLSQLASTGNNLETVKVVTDAAQTVTFASLTIGNSESGHAKGDTPSYDNTNALKDVQTFDASGLKGDLTLFAGLSQEVTAKYLNVKDVDPNAAADNVNFAYSGGSGKDYINLYLEGANLAKPGTSSREDLTLTVNGNGNDDTIVVRIDEDQVSSSNWYANQQINANLKIGKGNSIATGQLQLNGNDGNDTIRNIGTGDFAINAGSGADTVYSDNTGDKAKWVLNAQYGATDNLLSQLPSATVSNIVNLNLTVTFKGYEKTVVVGGATAGSLTGVSINDLSINQAIKDAINNDAVLNKLLVAEDGPARTLVITSLIDGVQSDVAGDFSDIGLKLSSTALTAGQAALATLHTLTATEASSLGFGVASGSAFTPTADTMLVNGRFDTYNDGAGSASNNESNSIIVPGTGNDVIVLSTGALSNEGVGYAGFENGTDYIVNFDTDLNLAAPVLVPPAVDVKEVVTLTFTASDGTPAAQTIIFDGQTIALSAPATQGVIPAVDVAYQFATQLNSANWTATHTPNTNTVTLTSKLFGNVTDLTAASFTGTYVEAAATGGGGTITPAVTTQGDFGYAATASTFTVDFDAAGTAAAAAGTFVFDGVTVNYAQGDGAITLAQAIVAQAAAFTAAGWTVALDAVDPTAVDFTSTVLGADPIATAADFDLGTNTIVGTVTGTVGTAVSTTPVYTTATTTNGLDYLDFTSYGAKAVYVGATLAGATLVTGAAPAVGQNYIVLTESATNAGEYTIKEYTLVGTTILDYNVVATTESDTLVGLIGVADFGATQAFVTENFHL